MRRQIICPYCKMKYLLIIRGMCIENKAFVAMFWELQVQTHIASCRVDIPFKIVIAKKQGE